jgi:hypothetical protein
VDPYHGRHPIPQDAYVRNDDAAPAECGRGVLWR